MAFDNVRLNPHIERGSKGGPGFKTTIITLSSGKEQRVAEWLHERGEWDISYGIMNKEDYRQVYDFFRARRGKFRGFRFKDWADYQATNEQIGIGDGATRTFKLVKNYDFYKKRITRPIAGTASVTFNGTPKTSGWSLNSDNGTITFNNHEDHIPGAGVVVRASFEFDLPVRFDIDKLDLRMIWERAATFPDIAIVELLEDDEELPA